MTDVAPVTCSLHADAVKACMRCGTFFCGTCATGELCEACVPAAARQAERSKRSQAVTGPQSLCETCGLCCDGTLFAHVTVTPEELAPIAGRVTLSSDWALLLQPCSALEGCRCAVYVDRPRICRAYRCFVLASFEAGQLTEPEARAALEAIFALRARLAAAVGEADPRRAVQLGRAQVAEGTASEEVSKLVLELYEAAAQMQRPAR